MLSKRSFLLAGRPRARSTAARTCSVTFRSQPSQSFTNSEWCCWWSGRIPLCLSSNSTCPAMRDMHTNDAQAATSAINAETRPINGIVLSDHSCAYSYHWLLVQVNLCEASSSRRIYSDYRTCFYIFINVSTRRTYRCTIQLREQIVFLKCSRNTASIWI